MPAMPLDTVLDEVHAMVNMFGSEASSCQCLLKKPVLVIIRMFRIAFSVVTDMFLNKEDMYLILN